MYVIEPGISKIIRRDPILFVTFNCPIANREMINDIMGEKFTIISFGTVKYIRMIGGDRQIVSDCTDYYNNYNDVEKLTSLPIYTKFTPEKSIQYPISYYYIRCDVLNELDCNDHEVCLQLAYYIYETYNRNISIQDDRYMKIIGDDIIHNLLNVTDEELANFNNYLVPVKEDSDGEK